MRCLYYNLYEFGKNVQSMRKRLKLTQHDVSNLTGVSVETLRKIENGRVIPKHETLDLLSPILKEDLNQLLLNYRIDNYYKFKRVINSIESKLYIDEYATLSIELDELKILLNDNLSKYFSNLLKQFILMVEAIILNKKHYNPNEAMNKLTEALKMTTPKFALSNYKSFVYNSIELRILMNMALVMQNMETVDKALEIMRFCLKTVEPEDSTYPEICYNIAHTYHKLNIHEKALKFSNLGTENYAKHKNYNGISLLYFRKGIAEYFLNHDCFMDSLNKSIVLCEVFKQFKLKDIIVDNCRSFYGIEL
ncbi:Transcriptional regulator, XRE family [[Clostridium] ultunense Esp]|nr:Transcriptional regulator, XRE family [[Clostridium] ultunense Esp]